MTNRTNTFFAIFSFSFYFSFAFGLRSFGLIRLFPFFRVMQRKQTKNSFQIHHTSELCSHSFWIIALNLPSIQFEQWNETLISSVVFVIISFVCGSFVTSISTTTATRLLIILVRLFLRFASVLFALRKFQLNLLSRNSIRLFVVIEFDWIFAAESEKKNLNKFDWKFHKRIDNHSKQNWHAISF